MKGKEKKKFEAQRIEELGGKAAKSRKTPYNILTGMRKKAAVREKKETERVSESP